MCGEGDYLLIVGARGSVVLEGLVGGRPHATEEEPSTDHQPRTPLASLAMNHCNVRAVFCKPVPHVLAELLYHLEGWSVMVVEWIESHCIELLVIVE